MEVVVRHIGSNQEKVVRIDRNLQYQNGGVAISLVDLWVLCAPHFTLDDDLALSVLYNGKFFSDPHDLIPLVTFARIELLQVPPSIVDKLHVDGTSLSDAISWISDAQNRARPSYSAVSDLTAAISTLSNSHQHQNETHVGAPNAQHQPAEIADPGAVAPPAPNQPNFFQQWVRVGLLARLAIFYFMFYHDRVESPSQQMLIIAGLLGVYLLQIGILSSLFSYLLSYLRRRNDVVRDAHQIPADANRHDPPRQLSTLQYIMVNIEHLVEHGIYIPRRPGLLFDAASLLIGLVCSLFPSWNAYQPPPVYGRVVVENAGEANGDARPQ